MKTADNCHNIGQGLVAGKDWEELVTYAFLVDDFRNFPFLWAADDCFHFHALNND